MKFPAHIFVEYLLIIKYKIKNKSNIEKQSLKIKGNIPKLFTPLFIAFGHYWIQWNYCLIIKKSGIFNKLEFFDRFSWHFCKNSQMLDQWPEFSFFIETFHYSNAVLFVAKIFVQIINIPLERIRFERRGCLSWIKGTLCGRTTTNRNCTAP